MKNIILWVALTCFANLCFAQSALNILEQAYIHFDNGAYKKAEKSFKQHFELAEGSKDDYYFMAASLSATGNEEDALHYAEKAYKGIETLGMMSEDSLFKPIHNEILRKYNEIKEFYTFYNVEFKKGRKAPLKKLDSLYKKLELKRISAYDLLDIANEFRYKDSIKASYYFKEAISNGPEYLSQTHSANAFSGYKYALYPFLKDFNKWNMVIRNNMMNWSDYSNEKLDSLVSLQEGWINQLPEPLIKRDFLLKLAYSYSLLKNYEKACNLIVKAINKSAVFEKDIQHLLFKKDYLKLFFKSEQGQNTLKYFISKYYESTFINADVIFKGVFQEESTSKRLIYDYLKAKNFESEVPKSFKIFKNESQVLRVAHSEMFKEKFESEFDYVFSVDTDGLIQVNNKKENDEKLVLGKKTSSLSYADKAGQYYLFPAENNLFINEIKEKKIGLNKISGVKNKHLVPLKKYGLAARLLTHIDSYGEALFVAKQIGLNDIVPTIVSLFKETPILGLTPIIEFTDDWLLLNHSSLFEIFNYKLNDTTSYHKLNNATAYYDTLSNRQRGVLFQIISNKLLKIFPHKALLGEESNFPNSLLFNKEGYSEILQWWEEYKSQNPFKKQQFVFNEKPLPTETGFDTYQFFIDEKTLLPIYYDDRNIFIESAEDKYSKYIRIENPRRGNYIQTVQIDEQGYLITHFPNDRPLKHLGLNEISEHDYEKLSILPDTLRQKKPGYLIKAFDNYTHVRCQSDTIFFNSLFKANNTSEYKNLIITNNQRTCQGDTTKYIENPYHLSSLESKQIDDKLYVLYNAFTSIKRDANREKFKCDKYKYYTYLLKLNDNLEIEHEIVIPQQYNRDYDLGINVDLITTSNKIYAFILPTDLDDEKAYYQVFDYDLNIISELIEIPKNTGTPQICELNDDVYIIYQSIENGENFLKMTHLDRNGNSIQELYLLNNRSPVLFSDLVKRKDNSIEYYYTDEYDDNYYMNKLSINLNIFYK